MKLVYSAICLIFASYATATHAEEPEISIEQIAGVYKIRKPNGIYNGVGANGKPIVDEYISEDVLEIVPHNENSFYFYKKTKFFNGHGCGIYGIANQTEPNTYLFDDHNPDPRLRCQLQASISQSKIQFTDITERDSSLEWQQACHNYCGARGVINDIWDRDKKRTIRYMPVLKNSKQYKDAVEGYVRANQPSEYP